VGIFQLGSIILQWELVSVVFHKIAGVVEEPLDDLLQLLLFVALDVFVSIVASKLEQELSFLLLVAWAPQESEGTEF
jgi:hypothetical protein